MKSTYIALLVWISLNAGNRCCASPEVLTFDEISLSPVYTFNPIPDGYGALGWENFYVLDQTDSRMSIVGYSNAFVSGTQIAAKYTGISVGAPVIRSGGSFDFVSGYFTAANNDGQQPEVFGFSGTTLVYDNSYTLNTTAPTLINFGYSGITEVRFVASGGTPRSPLVYGEKLFAMDSLTINQIPEPTASSLLACGTVMGLLGLLGHRTCLLYTSPS